MNVKTILYWICTVLICALSAMSAFMVFSRNPEAAAGTAHLGYPGYFMFILATWYSLGILALLAPGFALLKEWTYAGYFFAFTGAVVTHVACGEPARAPMALIAILLLAGSYLLRPASRRLTAATVAVVP